MRVINSLMKIREKFYLLDKVLIQTHNIVIDR